MSNLIIKLGIHLGFTKLVILSSSRVQRKDYIFVVLNQFIKLAHFFSVTANWEASQVAELFFQEVFRLQELLKTIVSDWDCKFPNIFWHELFRLVGTKLKPSTSYDP